MQLRVGGFFFPVNSVRVGSQVRTNMAESRVPLSRTISMRVSGWLPGNGEAALSLASSLLDTALKIPYKDIVLNQSNGRPSSIQLLNAGSISGVVVTDGPNFPTTDGGQFVNERYFEFTAEAEYPYSTAAGLITRFEETVTFSGGGPKYIWLDSINAGPQKQQLFPGTAFRAVQTGSITGYLFRPPPASAIWPSLLDESPTFSLISPSRVGPTLVNWGIRWEYKFASGSPLVGTPHLWPG